MEIKLKKKITFNMIIQAVMFVILVAADRFTKWLAVSFLKGNEPVSVIEGIVDFQYLENTGAAFGIFKDKQWMFYIITVIVVALIVFLWISSGNKLKKYVSLSAEDHSVFLSRTYDGIIFLGYLLSALCAGAIGNLIDRVFQKYVVDFIYFKIIDFPIFNFADICVTLTAVCFIVFFIFVYKEDPNFSIWGKTAREKEAESDNAK